MTHDIAFLGKVYERMHQVGLVQSKVEFSTQMLGKGSSYLTSMSARDRNVPDDVIEHLRQRIDGDINDVDIKTAELEEELRRYKLEQTCRRELLSWVSVRLPVDEPDSLKQPKPSSTLIRLLSILRWHMPARARQLHHLS